ncbi:upstream stimulatory factor 2 [Ctenocephalides felis]|uniref:upstream stimulatory factor 2 n=1 Tax=Ctenocephalides felis TaxID=7515 RepID=UPI000E6E1C13|nr:upstream stimulatory factor 2 [Ctenocephalides felis]
MEKIEYSLDNSGDGEEILGVIDESSGSLAYSVIEVKTEDSMDPLISAGPSYSPNGSQQAMIASPIDGQYYVIGGTDVFAAQTRSLAPRLAESGRIVQVTHGIKKRDDRRRATHNEVERRRRDKINNWITKLAKIISEGCHNGNGKLESIESQSKGGILAKACEYITELRDSNQSLQECLKEQEKKIMELEKSQKQINQLKRDNDILRAQLSQPGSLDSLQHGS